MPQVFKFHSILIPIVVIIITFHLTHSNCKPNLKTGITTNMSDWSLVAKLVHWVWGPPGTITVDGANQSSSIFSFGGGYTAKVDISPEWSILSLSFPAAGMEVSLV